MVPPTTRRLPVHLLLPRSYWVAWLVFWLALCLWIAPPSPLSPGPGAAQTLSLRQIWSSLPVARREALVQRFLVLKASAWILLGQSGAQATSRLLRLEFYGQAQGNPSAFDQPEQSLEAAYRWLRAIHALQDYRWPNLEPLPLAPEYVLPHLEAIQQAGTALGIPSGSLAAIADNEQKGGNSALGLSRGVRLVADELAQELAQATGSAGQLSRTLGLTQMSWEDALKQQQRLRIFGAWPPNQPFPTSEAEARLALENPQLNLLLAASRLRGWLGSYYHLSPRNTRALGAAWIYYLVPAWHNNPLRAQQEAVWPYAFHGFFKGWLYKTVFNDPARARLLESPTGATGSPARAEP